MTSPSICLDGVDSVHTLKKLLGKNPGTIDMIFEYRFLLSYFKKLCTKYNDVEIIEYNLCWMINIRDFMCQVRNYIIPLVIKHELFRESVKKMLCWKPHDPDQTSWVQDDEDATFMKWLCFKTAYMGFRLLGIRQCDTHDLGAPESEEMKTNMRKILFDTCEHNIKRGLKAKVEKAMEAFFLTHELMSMRCDLMPLCEETESSLHKYQRSLMYALIDITGEWLSLNSR